MKFSPVVFLSYSCYSLISSIELALLCLSLSVCLSVSTALVYSSLLKRWPVQILKRIECIEWIFFFLSLHLKSSIIGNVWWSRDEFEQIKIKTSYNLIRKHHLEFNLLNENYWLKETKFLNGKERKMTTNTHRERQRYAHSPHTPFELDEKWLSTFFFFQTIQIVVVLFLFFFSSAMISSYILVFFIINAVSPLCSVHDLCYWSVCLLRRNKLLFGVLQPQLLTVLLSNFLFFFFCSLLSLCFALFHSVSFS